MADPVRTCIDNNAAERSMRPMCPVRLKESQHRPVGARLATLADFQPGESLYCGEVARRHLYRHQHAPMPTPLSVLVF
jgi:hypothetical protein